MEEFCPRCGIRLILKTRSRGLLCCPKCGYESELSDGIFLKSKFSPIKPFDSSIAVLDGDALNLRMLPTVSAYCQKCGGNRAETWTIATGSEGISSITFHRCISCGHTWREIG